jgi:hypothetical protein
MNSLPLDLHLDVVDHIGRLKRALSTLLLSYLENFYLINLVFALKTLI